MAALAASAAAASVALGAAMGQAIQLFDHLVGEREQPIRNLEAEPLADLRANVVIERVDDQRHGSGQRDSCATELRLLSVHQGAKDRVRSGIGGADRSLLALNALGAGGTNRSGRASLTSRP